MEIKIPPKEVFVKYLTLLGGITLFLASLAAATKVVLLVGTFFI